MRILVLSTVPYTANGIATVIKNLYANKTFAAEDITFVFPGECDGEMVAELSAFGYDVITGASRFSNPIRYVSFLVKLMKEKKIELVHVHGSSAMCLPEMWAAFCAKVPVRIAHCHSNKNKYAFLHKVFKPTVNKLATAAYACSSAAGEFLFGKRPFTVINNAFDVARYEFDAEERQRQRAALGIADTTVVIGHVGVFNTPKNQIFLVEAFEAYHRKNPDSALLLIGDGPLKEYVEQSADKMNIGECVHMLGSRDDVYKLLNAMDCFVFPSIHEGFGIAPVEAQANGLSVISACDNIPKDIRINAAFRFISLSEGKDAWADAISKMQMQRDPCGASNVINAGFDISATVDKLHTEYAKLLDQGN